MGAEIWVKVGDPPPSELSFLSPDTRTPYVADYPGDDCGEAVLARVVLRSFLRG